MNRISCALLGFTSVTAFVGCINEFDERGVWSADRMQANNDIFLLVGMLVVSFIIIPAYCEGSQR